MLYRSNRNHFLISEFAMLYLRHISRMVRLVGKYSKTKPDYYKTIIIITKKLMKNIERIQFMYMLTITFQDHWYSWCVMFV